MNIVITGSTRGIGLAAAKQLLRDGHAVTICSEDEADVTTALAALESEGLQARGIRCDVSMESDIEALLNFARENGRDIDAWINNAGMPGVTGRTDELPTDYLRRVIAVNIQGTCLGQMLSCPEHTIIHGRNLFRTQAAAQAEGVMLILPIDQGINPVVAAGLIVHGLV